MECDYIKCGDCTELITSLESDSISLILTSPPYNIIRPNLDDRGYDVYQDVKSNDEYIEWTVSLFNDLDRVLKKDGAILYNLSYGTENNELMWLVIASIIEKTNFTVGDCIVWKKATAMPNPMSKNKCTRICEYVLVFCRKDEYNSFNMNKKVKSYRKTGQANYENIYNFVEAKNNDGSCSLNKATFSTDLVTKLLDMYSTSEDDIILDPFMGTGTTAVGCVKRNRHYIGFELSEDQCSYAENRILDAELDIA